MGGGGSMIPAEIPAGAAEHSSYFGGELHGAAGNAMYFVHVLLELTDTDTQTLASAERDTVRSPEIRSHLVCSIFQSKPAQRLPSGHIDG